MLLNKYTYICIIAYMYVYTYTHIMRTCISYIRYTYIRRTQCGGTREGGQFHRQSEWSSSYCIIIIFVFVFVFVSLHIAWLPSLSNPPPPTERRTCRSFISFISFTPSPVSFLFFFFFKISIHSILSAIHGGFRRFFVFFLPERLQVFSPSYSGTWVSIMIKQFLHFSDHTHKKTRNIEIKFLISQLVYVHREKTFF